MPRWIQQGQLVNITRGRYALPVRSRFGTRPSAPESMTAQLNLEGAQQLVSSGAVGATPGVGCPAFR